MDLSTVIYAVTLIATIIYLFSKWKFSYWKDRNVRHLEPTFFYGNLKPSLQRKKHLSEIVSEIYNEAKANGDKYCGMYAFWSPQFIPIDVELIRCIMQKDFSHFVNHGFYVNEETDPLTGHLFNLEDDKWRNLRAKLTPTFTSGKMKMMFQTIIDCTNDLQTMLKECLTINEPVDIKEVLSRFTTDVIGSVAFGLDINSMKNTDSDFRKYGKTIFEQNFRKRIIFILISLLPRSILKRIGLKTVEKNMETFFINMVKDTVENREKNNIYRKDFMHLLIQLKNMGKVTDDDDSSVMKKNNSKVQGLTINEMAAQTFVFFAAGFETSATTMTFGLLELAQNPEFQDKAREEIVNVLKQYENKVTYEAILEMEYLEKIIAETLRKHPPLYVIPRVCNKDYKVPDSDLVVKAGVRVQIPVFSIHRDPEYYPNPEQFDPERFSEENKASRPGFCYMPFGEGPRTCIGLRFGKLQAKVGLCSILSNFRVKLNEKTQTPIKYKTGFILEVKDGVWLDLISLSN